MATAADMLDNIVPISDFSRGKATQAFEKARGDKPVFVMRNNEPVAVIISPEEYKYLSELEEDLYFTGLAIERLEANKGKELLTWDEVRENLGITQEEVDAVPDEDVEFDYE